MKFKYEFRAYQITIRPKEVLQEETIRKIVKWMNKKCKHVLCVLEKHPVAHIHAAMYFDQPQNKKSIQETVWKMVKPLHPTSIGKYCVLVQVMPGSKWVNEYLSKQEDTDVLLELLPPEDADEEDRLDSFYPTPKEQEQLQAAKGKPFEGDRVLDVHEDRYKEYLDSKGLGSTITNAVEYFLWRVNVDRSMPRIRDSRSYVSMGLALHRYISMDNTVTPEEESLIRRVTESFDFSGR